MGQNPTMEGRKDRNQVNISPHPHWTDKDAEVRLWWSAAIRQHQRPNLHKQSGGRGGAEGAEGLNLGLCPDKPGLWCHATDAVFYSFSAVLSMSKLRQSSADLASVGKHPRHLCPVCWPVPDSYGLFLSGICVPNSQPGSRAPNEGSQKFHNQ